MSAFDKIIGYDSIKTELMQVCDMLHNRELYTKMGAELPRGIILYGEPGLGKTVMAKAFIEYSGIPAFTIRKNKNEDEFISSITEAFENAKENAPCVVFLDDLDKFANSDMRHRDAEEYVAVQAGIDDVANIDVFVLATANDIEKLPPSLLRAGRFDREIEFESPTAEDAEKIIKYYLSEKRISSDVNLEDLSKMISYTSCAELETIINEAAITATFKRKECIEMKDLINAVLKWEYNDSDENYNATYDDETRSTALHEAGHLVCSEAIEPGSIGFVSIRTSWDGKGMGGFTRRCKDVSRRPHSILISLASKAAVELYYAEHVASGCHKDLDSAYRLIESGLTDNATMGLGLLGDRMDASIYLQAKRETVTQALLENYMLQAKNIIIKNRKFLELATDELMQKGMLLYSDIKRIREKVEIVAA